MGPGDCCAEPDQLDQLDQLDYKNQLAISVCISDVED